MRNSSFTAAAAVTLCFFVVPCFAANTPADNLHWLPTGPFGGNAEVIAATEQDPNFLLAATKNANLFASNDAGDHWTALAFPRQYSAMLHTLAIHPANPKVIFAAIAEENLPGLYRSDNAGRAWKPVTGLKASEVYSITFWAEDPDVMAAGTREGVQLSRDGGVTWAAISPQNNVELQPVVSVAFDPHNASIIYAGTPRLPWKTTDGGQNWTLIADGMSTDSDIITVRVDPTRPSRVFIGACSGFWRTNNAGELWAKYAGIPFTSRRTYAFAQDATRPELIFAGTSRGLYRTSDAGAQWREIAQHEIKSLAICGKTLYIATADAGLFKTTDEGQTLQPINIGFTSRSLIPPTSSEGDVFTATTLGIDSGSVFASHDGGLHWNEIATPAQLENENVESIARTQSGFLIAATDRALFRSLDGGRLWGTLKLPAGTGKINALASRGTTLIAGGEFAILRSTDEGATWRVASKVSSPVTRIVGDSTLIAISNRGLLVSSDEGRTWNVRQLPFFVETYDIAAAGNVVVAGTSRGAFRSEDEGATWWAAKTGLPKASVTVVAVDPAAPRTAYAFEYGQLFKSEDAGMTWRLFDAEGLGGAFIRSMVFSDSQPRRLLAVTATRGIFAHVMDAAGPYQSSYTALELRKDRNVPNQQNENAPAF